MALPDAVLKKLYYKNALALVPGLPKDGWPRVMNASGDVGLAALGGWADRAMRSRMARYTVTGGAGFIGSHLAEELLRRGHAVRIVDNFSTGKRENIEAAARSAAKRRRGHRGVEGDLADLDVAHRAAAGADYVLHQAAIPSVPRSVKDPIASNRANIDGTLNMLVAARDAGVKRLVFAGSSSEYGDTPTLPKHEEMPTEPAVALRAPEGRGRRVPADVHAALRPRDGQHPLLQRLRPAPGSRLARTPA